MKTSMALEWNNSGIVCMMKKMQKDALTRLIVY